MSPTSPKGDNLGDKQFPALEISLLWQNRDCIANPLFLAWHEAVGIAGGACQETIGRDERNALTSSTK